MLYLGQYYESKGVYELVDAMEILLKTRKDIEVDFYGTKEMERFRRYVEEKGLCEKVRINGWIDDDKKLEALSRSTMLILPSHTEGTPNVILEAMATKTPVVSTWVGGLREILKGGENAIIAEVGNPLDLSQKLFELPRRLQLKKNNCNQCLQRLWSKI